MMKSLSFLSLSLRFQLSLSLQSLRFMSRSILMSDSLLSESFGLLVNTSISIVKTVLHGSNDVYGV